MANARHRLAFHLALDLALLVSASATARGAEAAASSQDLVVNGGFELSATPPPQNNFVRILAPSTSIHGWRVWKGDVHLCGRDFWQSYDGGNNLDIDGHWSGGIEQTLTTEVGRTYALDFAMAGNVASAPTIKPLQVCAGATCTRFDFDTTGKTFQDLGWVRKAWTFTANSTQTVLRFESLTGVAGVPASYGALIDDVHVRLAGTAEGTTQYLAEGARSSSFFDMRLALLNPGITDTTATLTFSKGDGATVTAMVPVPAGRRVTVDPGGIAGLAPAEFSTKVQSDQRLVVDRTMSWDVSNGYGAHAETAVDLPALTWYLAEGSTVGGFNLFYLLQNPGVTPATVQVRYLLPSGAPLEKTYALPADSRTNIWVNYEVFPLRGRVLASTDVSAVIEVTNAQPIIVERAMYLDVPGQTFGAGHESAGVTAPATQWFLAEGATGPFFDLFVLIANPNSSDAQVEATYLLPGGTTIVKPYTVPGNSRYNIWVDHEDQRLANTAVSTTILSTNGAPVVVERAMWWPGAVSNWYEAHNSAGSRATGTTWALAEGEVGGTRGVDTYILIANTSPTAGQVRVTLLFEDGMPTEKTFTLAANSRFNVDARYEFPTAMNRRFGAVVQSLGTPPAQIVVERAMYWDAGGQRWAAGTNALGTRLQ